MIKLLVNGKRAKVSLELLRVIGINAENCEAVHITDRYLHEVLPQSRHGLDFTSAPWGSPYNTDGWKLYRIGTVHGQWRAFHRHYAILSLLNDEPGNGHLEDVFDWFEYSCLRDGKALRVMEIMNERFLKHLIEKRGFVKEGKDAIKHFYY